MDALEAIKTRTSVRAFLPDPLPEGALEELVDCARLAPTGYNRQAWAFVAVTEPGRRAEIAAAARYGRFIAEAPACIAVLFGKDAITPLEDACAATENILVAARALGLGACWVNSHRKEHSERVKELLRCPPDYELAALVAVGRPAPATPRDRAKKPLSEVLRRETF